LNPWAIAGIVFGSVALLITIAVWTGRQGRQKKVLAPETQ
jgi:hypothetical protein